MCAYVQYSGEAIYTKNREKKVDIINCSQSEWYGFVYIIRKANALRSKYVINETLALWISHSL